MTARWSSSCRHLNAVNRCLFHILGINSSSLVFGEVKNFSLSFRNPGYFPRGFGAGKVIKARNSFPYIRPAHIPTNTKPKSRSISKTHFGIFLNNVNQQSAQQPSYPHSPPSSPESPKPSPHPARAFHDMDTH
jgi:hypothetical protein